MDLGLPDLSGHQVLAELRARPALAEATIIALSGETPAPEAGFDAHLLKPVELSALLALLARHV